MSPRRQPSAVRRPPTGARRARPRAQRRRLHPLAIAVTVILVTAFVAFFAFNQGLPFVHRFTVHAVVSNSVNVRQDAPVRIAGIDVGTVTGVAPLGRASEVTFTLADAGLPIHRDATIRIRDRLFLEGAYYLELDPGSPSAPPAPDGYTIPLSQTASPVQFYQFLSTFNLPARTSLQRLLDSLDQGFSPAPGEPQSSGGAAAFKSAVPQLTPVFRDLAWINRGLRGTRPGDVGTLLRSAGHITATLAASETELTHLVHDLNVTSTALASADGALGQSVSGLDSTLRAAPSSLVAIDRALPPVVDLAAALHPSLTVSPPILDSVSAAVRQLAQVVAPAGRKQLLSTLQATFVQFPVINRLLAAAFPITKPVSDCLRTHLLPLLRAQVPDGSLSTGRPVWQDFVHFLPSVAGASGGFDANGPYTRVLAGAGSNSVSGGPGLGSIPLLGQLFGSAPPGGSSLLGARPTWAGDLTPGDFRPELPCATQPVPSLAAPAAAGDLRPVSTPAPRRLSSAELRRLGRQPVGGR